MRFCPSVRPSVRPLVHPSVMIELKSGETSLLDTFFVYVCMCWELAVVVPKL